MRKSLVKSQWLMVTNCTRAFSLVEMLFYVALLSLSLVAVGATLVIVTRSYGHLKVSRAIEQDAASAFNRMIREIHDAQAVNPASVLGAHPGELVLTTTDSAGSARSVDFYLSNGILTLKENGVVRGALTSNNTSVTTLIFRKITSTRSQGVKIEMTLQGGAAVASSTETFYTTAVLKDSY